MEDRVEERLKISKRHSFHEKKKTGKKMLNVMYRFTILLEIDSH